MRPRGDPTYLSLSLHIYLKAPPLPPVPTLVAIEIITMVSKCVVWAQFLIPVCIILRPWVAIWLIQGYPGAAKRSPEGTGIDS